MQTPTAPILRHGSWLVVLVLAIVAIAGCTAPTSGASSAPDVAAPTPAASDGAAPAAPGDYEYEP